MRVDRGRRGVSTPLSHVFSLSITSVLIVLVLVGASGQVQDQRERAAHEELGTIGNRLAAEIQRVDGLGVRGGNATVTVSHPGSVVGTTYGASIESGPACETPRMDATECLVLDATGLEVTVRIPLNLSTSVELRQPTGGTFLLTTGGAPGASTGTAEPITGAPIRLGIGRDVSLARFGSVVSPANSAPIAAFEFSPGNPTSATPVEFSAAGSRDIDGTIASYAWAVDDDTFDTTGETVSVPLDPGMHSVTLQVIDDDGGRSNVTRSLWVSGLEYNDDLDSYHYFGSPDEESIRFTVTNRWTGTTPDHVTVTEILIDPEDPAVDTITVPDLADPNAADDDPPERELLVDTDDSGSYDRIEIDQQDIPADGLVVPVTGEGIEIENGDTAEFRLRGFNEDMDGKVVTIGLRYSVEGRTNVTVFTDAIGGPSIESFALVRGGDSQDIDARVNASRQLGTIDVALGGKASGALSAFDFTLVGTDSDGNYVYRADVTDGVTGTIKANLTEAAGIGGGTESGDTIGSKSLNRSVVVLPTAYAWQTASDWDGAQRSARVVHASYGSRDRTTVSLGYPTSDEGGSSLVGYWHMDDPGSADDVSGENNDGTVNSSPGEDIGVFGTPGTEFDGTDDYIEIPNDPSLETHDTDEVTVSAWVRKDTDQSGRIAILQHSEESYNLHFRDGEEPAFTIYGDGDGPLGFESHHTAFSNTPLVEDRWYHLVGTFDDSNEVRIYIDGTLYATEDAADIEATGDPVGMASNLDTGGRHLDGSIDEVRVYDRSLSESEVDRLYRTSRNGTLGTDWKSGPSIDPAKAEIQYDASVPAGTRLNATVLVDADGDGTAEDRSDVVRLADGSGTANVTGLSTGGSRYRVVVTFNSTAVVNTPELNAVGIDER